MSFLLIVVISLVVLGAIAAIASIGDKDEPIVQKEGDCGSCSSRAECKLADLKEDIRKRKLAEDEGTTDCGHHDGAKRVLSAVLLCVLTSSLLLFSACSTKKNTSTSRFWQSFTARYNTYFNGSQAFIEGNLEKENGNKDNCTELIPLYPVANKGSRDLGKANYDRAIEKSEKVIKLKSIKRRPEWNKGRRKTAKDIEWLNRREYNPFLWHAWLLMGKSQFQKGEFEEAATTFSYMARLYQTQPPIRGIARAWQAKCYVEMDWLYDAEDVIVKQHRDSIHYRARKDWDYTLADYYIRSERYQEAVPYLRKVISHERRRKQRAREWFLLGQIQTLLGNKLEAYKAYQHTIRLNPPYELEFNARIAQTEVMPATDFKKKISKLKRMARSDNNKDYLEQVYYAIGNVYMTQRDTTNAIAAYEEGCKKATRSGIEKGVLLLTLGNLYWDKEKYSDAKRCYGEAIGLLDKDRKDYQQLSERSKVLDELVPHTDAIALQDSLQRLAKLPEDELHKVIDKIIEDLIKKEKEEKRKQEEAEAERKQQEEEARNGNMPSNNRQPMPTMPGSTSQSGQWYFYNPQAVSQGKQAFQRQWGKRQNTDDWQRVNRTVVDMNPASIASKEYGDSLQQADMAAAEAGGTGETGAAGDSIAAEKTDSAALDPHNREYYLAQIPFTEEQVAESNNIIKEGLFNSGVIFKDKLDNLPLSEKAFTRLTSQYPEYERNDESWYHLWLLYSRQGRTEEADRCLAMLKADYPESDWTILLSDPNFFANQRFGVHIEDSIYAATYEAFKQNRHQEVRNNTLLSEQRFPLGQHRPKFLFIEGLSLLNDGNSNGCVERMKQVVEKYPDSEVSEMAGMILRGVQQGRQLHGGSFDMDDVWSRRMNDLTGQDSTKVDSLIVERNANYVFLLLYQPDSISQNQLLYEMAKYNFSNFMVRNFDIAIDQDPHGLARMSVSGFLNYDEARQYARLLYDNKAMATLLRPCRSLVVSEKNLPLLGTAYSYRDYEVFFQKELEPMTISKEPLLDEPESVVTEPEEEEEEEEEEAPVSNEPFFNQPVVPQQPAVPQQPVVPQQPANSNDPVDDIFNNAPPQQNNGYIEFDDDFWR